MKVLRSVIKFFADDLLTAGLIIAWVILAAVLHRAGMLPSSNLMAVIYVAGIVAVLAFGAIRRARIR